MIRSLKENDVDAFIKIRGDSLRLDPKSFGAMPNVKIDRDKTIKDLSEKNGENFILGYFDDSELIGIVGFIREQREKTKHKGFIWGVFVYNKYRGKKIGKKLMTACITKASSITDLKKIILSVSNISSAALQMYQNLGFTIYGTETNSMIWEGEILDTILMEKTLS